MIKKISLVCYQDPSSVGVMVIVNSITQIFQEKGYFVSFINVRPNIEQIKDSFVIAYGPKELYDLVKNNIKVDLSLMVDYYSMGQFHKFFYYLKRKKFFFKDFWYSLFSGILYYYKEYYSLKKCKNVMFVSDYDAIKMKKRFPNHNYYIVPNGVSIVDNVSIKVQSEKIRLGILSVWSYVSMAEVGWFIEDILPKLCSKFPNIELIVAGKGATRNIEKYFTTKPNVKYIGFVKSLDDFYKNIDIYVATVPRGCGILNKVLDSFAYKTFVIGNKESFSGFIKMHDCYITCNSYEDYVNAINLYLEDKNSINIYINNSYKYIIENKFYESLVYDKVI